MHEIVCEIKTRLILWKYQVILVIAYTFIIKVINYALSLCDIRLRVSVHGTHIPIATCSHLEAYRL